MDATKTDSKAAGAQSLLTVGLGDADRRIVTTNKNSNHFGVCDQCGKHCGEVFKCQTKISKTAWLNVAYGHKECLEREFPEYASPNVELRGCALLRSPA